MRRQRSVEPLGCDEHGTNRDQQHKVTPELIDALAAFEAEDLEPSEDDEPDDFGDDVDDDRGSYSFPALAGQAPGAASDPDVAISHRDRVYAAEQFSNTVSVTDPADNKLLGVIRLGDPQPGNLSPLYRGQVLVHGMGFSPNHKTLAVVSIGSNSVPPGATREFIV